jgi:hypothetical protein
VVGLPVVAGISPAASPFLAGLSVNRIAHGGPGDKRLFVDDFISVDGFIFIAGTAASVPPNTLPAAVPVAAPVAVIARREAFG